MRIIMMGTGAFAVPTFCWLCQSAHQVLALVTRPAKPGVGGKKAPPRPMFQEAQQRGIAIFEPASINDPASIQWLRQQRPELLVVCDYGEILRPEALEVANYGGINLHGSLLPKYRGAAPVAWALLHGETQTGVTVIHMTPQLDAGPILVQRVVAIGPEETAVELEARLAQVGVEAVQEAIDLLAAWDRRSPLGTPQNPAEATKAPRLTKGMGRVDWHRPASAICNQVRALVPWPGTYTFWTPSGADSRPLRIILHKVRVISEPADFPSQLYGEPGTVVVAEGGRLWVRAGEGSVLAIEQLQPEGKRPMTAGEFLRGHPLSPGSHLG